MTSESKLSQYLSGVRSGIPVILGFIPVGIAYAIMARQAGFSIMQTCGMSLAVFAGASQMMAVGMYSEGAGIIAMIIATFILNLRHLIMSTCVMSRMKDGNRLTKLLSAFGVTDESFAIFTTLKKEKCTVMYFLGLVTVSYSSWNIGTLIGAAASGFLPDILTASLGISLYAMFISLLVPNLTRNFRLCALVLLTAVTNSLLTRFIPSSWALIASTLVCAFIGTFFVPHVQSQSTDESDSDKNKV